MKRQLTFLFALWKANLLAAMEYRASFLSQVVGMMLNNLIYFFFWVIFFDRFEQVRGWGLHEMLVLFGVTASAFGLSVYLFGNLMHVAETVATGRLDYYLSLPRPVLLHLLASGSHASGLGDFSYGILSFVASGLLEPGSLNPGSLLRFLLGVLLGMVIFLSFMVLVQSLAFWLGNAQMLANQAFNAVITFALYPITLFDGTAKLLLFTVVPAALMGAVPAEFITRFGWENLFQMLGAATIFFILSLWAFHAGLRRYESGSAIQVQL